MINIKQYIIKRLDDKSLNEYLPKRKDLKIIIKCSNCGYTRQSNSFDVLNRHSTLCIKCSDTKPKQGYSYRKRKKYRENMRKSMKKSQAWKDTQYLRIEGIKNHWKKVRGGKELHEVATEWELYKKLVYSLTEKNYKQFKRLINPNKLPRGKDKYHIDHRFSVLEGFKNNILPYIIAHPFNLQILFYKDNLSKDFKCSITKRELLEGSLST